MELQSGTVHAVFFSQTTNPLYNSPILQITSLSKFSFGPNEKHRYKANLSDGVHYMKAVFSSELTDKFDKNEISKYHIIKLSNFTVRPKDNNNYVYVQSIIESQSYSSEIGQAVNIASGVQSLEPPSNMRISPENSSYKANQDSYKENLKDASRTTSSHSNEVSYNKVSSKRNKTEDEDDTVEIRKIFPHKKNLKFRGRVVSKTEMKTFNSQKGEGKVFSFEIADKTGQIKCVAFSEIANMFYPIVENNKVYSISNVSVRASNKKYSGSTSDFEIHLEKNTEIVKIEDDDIPKFMLKLMKISELPTAGGGLVDCLGVIKDVYPMNKVVIKSTGKENSKRDLVIIDQTGTCRLTIWGLKAEEEYEKDSILCIKGGRVGEYNGVTLSTISTSQLITNIDIPESLELMSWYQDEGKNIVVDKPKKSSKRTLISEAKDSSREYSTIQATVMHVKEENMFYPACPGEGCNKKVSMEDNGIFRCEKCNYTFEKCSYRYTVNIHVGDFSGQMWISLFDDCAKTLFGISAEEMKDMGESNPEEVHSLIKKMNSKEFQFRIKNKEENYNGDIKLRTNCLEVIPIDCIFETKKMLDAIEKAL